MAWNKNLGLKNSFIPVVVQEFVSLAGLFISNYIS